MRCVVQQIAAVNERNDLHAGRQNVTVQFLYFLVEPFEGLLPIGAFSHGDPGRNHIIVVDDLPIFTVNRPGELAKANLRPLRDDGNILYAQRSATLGHKYNVFDIPHVLDEAHFPNIDLLQTSFDEAATRIDVVVAELLLHLGKAESVGDQFVRVNANLIFAGGATEASHIDDIGDGLEVLLDHPIFDGL